MSRKRKFEEIEQDFDAESWISELELILEPEGTEMAKKKHKMYMRGQFEYYGLMTPLRRSLSADFIKKMKTLSIENAEKVVRLMWDHKYRDMKYIAQDYLKWASKKLNKSSINLLEYAIVTESWWDTIDILASNIVGQYFKKFPEEFKPVTRRWMDSDNIWLQRSALLSQLKYKTETDTNVMFEYIKELMDSDEFFIRKAIGWVLREYAKTNASVVRKFVRENQDELSVLSKREALKHIG